MVAESQIALYSAIIVGIVTPLVSYLINKSKTSFNESTEIRRELREEIRVLREENKSLRKRLYDK